MVTSLARSLRSNINEEGLGGIWDSNGVEQMGARRVEATGGCISRVLHARYISCVYCPITILQKLEDESENMIGGPVGTALFPPALNNSLVVSIDDNVVTLA